MAAKLAAARGGLECVCGRFSPRLYCTSSIPVADPNKHDRHERSYGIITASVCEREVSSGFMVTRTTYVFWAHRSPVVREQRSTCSPGLPDVLSVCATNHHQVIRDVHTVWAIGEPWKKTSAALEILASRHPQEFVYKRELVMSIASLRDVSVLDSSSPKCRCLLSRF